MRNRLLAVWRSLTVGACLALTLASSEARAVGLGASTDFTESGFGVSPDGSMLAYALPAPDKSSDPVSEIWISKVDGSEKRRVASLPGLWDVDWVDASRLVASHFGSNRLFFIPLSGGRPTVLFLTDSFQDAEPAVAPDGRYVAFSAIQTKPAWEHGVFVLDVGTGEVRRISWDLVKSFVAWSPDSKRVVYGIGAYWKDYKVTIVDVASGAAVDTGCLGVGVRWSPDGNWIAYTGNILRGGSWYNGVPCDGSVIKMNVATKETVVLTESPVNTRDEKTGRWEEAGAIYPAWSSDSLKIAYRRIHMVTTYREDHQGDVNEDQIWVMNADGSNQKPVWESFGIYAWARDGRSLFVKDGKGITEVAIDSGIRRQITLWVHP